MKPWTSSVGIVFMAWLALTSSGICSATRADGPPPLPFDVKAEVVHKELSPEFCWFHPRVAAIPGAGKDGRPAVVMTIQKHLVGLRPLFWNVLSPNRRSGTVLDRPHGDSRAGLAIRRERRNDRRVRRDARLACPERKAARHRN